MMKTLSSQLDDNGIFTITINVKKESMNIFSQQVMDEFADLIDDIDNNTAIKGVIFCSGKPDCFIAGADINMLQQAKSAEEGSEIVSRAHQLLQRISKSKKIFIAAIDGICLGAGYELALACDYRIASNHASTKIGLPEVMLGLLPGATGTSKLSRLIALPSALDLMLTGKQLNAKHALTLGMIDECVPRSILIPAAEKALQTIITGKFQRKKIPLSQRILSLPGLSHIVLKKARQQVLKKTKGLYPAPLAIVDVIEYGLHKPLDEALAYEAKRFGELTVSSEAKQLINIYFATTDLKKETFIESDCQAQAIQKVGILGGGLMGSGIATVSIDKANTNVRVKDISQKGLLQVHQHLESYYRNRTKRKIISSEAAKKKIHQLSSTLLYNGFESCDIVIEAVFEDITVKHQMLNGVEALENPNTIFASNTSSIPITEIASKAKRPENVIGMHYFSPVEKMPLLEIIKHDRTSDQTIANTVALGKRQGKTVIVVNDGAGFYVNRILTPYLNAAMLLVMEGIAIDHIDNTLVNAGFPVGPAKLLDEVGIDVASKISPILEKAFGERMKSNGIQDILINKGRLGKKASKGFYSYSDKNNHLIDHTIYDDLNITPNQSMNDKAIVEYCLLPMLNEAAHCLEENIILSARDGDIGAIFGIGFPPFLGGPFRYMDSWGIEKVVSTLQSYEEKHGSRYTPANILINMAQQQGTFY